MKPGQTGLRRIWSATFNSMRGIRLAWKFEAAFRQDMMLGVILISVAVTAPVSTVERVLMIGAVLLLLMIELLNSGIEAAIDRIGPERHELSGMAKDVASAAVFFALVNLAVTYILILGPWLWQLSLEFIA